MSEHCDKLENMKVNPDIYLFREGTHTKLYNELGCHLRSDRGADFAVWAPNAAERPRRGLRGLGAQR